MAQQKNPNHNSVQQAMLDASSLGLGNITVDDAIKLINKDSKLRTALQNKWNSHVYPERSMEWVQLTRAQQLMLLSDQAVKVLVFMGMYAYQSSMLQISYKDLCTLTGLKDRTLRYAIKELIEFGCIRVEAPSKRHAAPIYVVNPAIINKGARRKQDVADFTSKIEHTCSSYLLFQIPRYKVQQETVRQTTSDGSKVAYNRITVEDNKKPSSAGTDKGSSADVAHIDRTQSSTSSKNDQVPGQYSTSDYPGFDPSLTDDNQDLPFA